MRIERYRIPMLVVSILLIIAAVCIGPRNVMSYVSSHDAEGTVLTSEFVQDYVGRAKSGQLIVASFAALIFGVIGLILSLQRSPARSGFAGVIGTIIWIVVSFTVIAIPVCRDLPLILYEPRVDTVQVTDRRIVTTRRKDIYRFTFSNGASDTVDQAAYESVPDGTTFYVIMCGGTCCESFNADEYSLPG